LTVADRTITVAVDAKSLSGQPTGVGRVLGGVLDAVETGADRTVQIRRLEPAEGARTLPWIMVGLPLGARGADVLHCPFYYRPLVAPCPTVIVVHDLLALTRPEWFPRRGRWRLGRLIRWSIRRAAAVITPSRCVLHEIEGAFGPLAGLGVAIPHGVDPDLFRPASPGLRDEVCARHRLGGRYLLHVGSLQARRGLDTAIEALHRLRSRHPGLELVLVGKTEHGWRAGLPDPSGVRQLGYVGEGDLAPLMSAAACVLALSRGEGFDLPLLEALACGAPVVASDIPPHREHFERWAELIPAGDGAAVAAVVDDLLAGRVAPRDGAEQAGEVHRAFRWRDAAAARIEVWRTVADRMGGA
jgi:glycosyltransferase involved in cell wall biosynthesis